jgi:hypothetical protein
MGRHHLVKAQKDGRVPLGVLGEHVGYRTYLIHEADDGTITLVPAAQSGKPPRVRHVFTPPEEAWDE